MIHGAFTLVFCKEKILWLKRKDSGKWDLPGGGFDLDEIDFRAVASREIQEETGIIIKRDNLDIEIPPLGQNLTQSAQEYYDFKIKYGFVFVLTTHLQNEPEVVISDEHTDHQWFKVDEVLENPEDFSIGPRKMLYAFLRHKKGEKLKIWLRDQEPLKKIALH